MAIIIENNLDEAKQVKEAQKDKRAFAQLYERYFDDIYKYIYRRLNDDSITADLTSQVFLKALLHLHKWKYEGLPFSSWLYKIALNECRVYFRSVKRIQYVVLDEKARSLLFEDATEKVAWEEKIQITEQLLYSLTKGEMQMIELRYYENLSFREIGYLLEITENTAKVRLHRVLNKLKKISHGKGI